MKNKTFLLVILAITLVFTMTVTGCDFFNNLFNNMDYDENGNNNGSRGTFNLTGIPSQYNGKYALLSGQNTTSGSSAPTVWIIGSKNINVATSTYTLCLISNGSVSLPMWSRNVDTITAGELLVRYTGNDTCMLSVFLFNSQTLLATDLPSQQIGSLLFGNDTAVVFANGSATRAWNDGYYMQKP